MAASFPLVTTDKIKVSAVSCKGPAVMKSPHYRLIIRREKAKQNVIIQIIAVNIMKMDDIGIIFPDFLNQPARSCGRIESLAVCQSGK